MSLDAAPPEELIRVALRATDDPERGVAHASLAQLIDTGVIDVARLSAAGLDFDALLAVAGLCSDAACLTQMIAAVDDPQVIAALVVNGATSRIRQVAAQRVHDPVQLKQLLVQVRGKDNGAYKILRRKHDALQAVELQATQQQNALQSACESLERHAGRVYDPAYAASFKYARDHWNTLATLATNDLQQRAADAIVRSEAIIAAHELRVAEQSALAEEQTAREAARQAARVAALALAEAQTREREQLAALAAEEAARQSAADEQARAARLAAEKQIVRQVGGLLAKANAALRTGDTGRAAGLHRAVAEKLGATPAAPPQLARQTQQLAAKLDELKAWKDYAAAPKRAELIAEMEGLIGAAEDPKVLAERIKHLQEDWKTVSKGVVSDSGADWHRFQQAATAAYQPCREYFAAQAKQRKQNLERRHDVLRRLKAFEAAQSGEHQDVAVIATVLREARQEWRRHAPVERAAGAPGEREFDAVLARLQTRLDAWYGDNIAAKQALIGRAQALLDKDDAREATDAAKQLQLLWKQIGAAPRDHEQRLWEDFRTQCDAVFQKRQHVHAQHVAELEANRARAVALCEEVERVAQLPPQPLREAAALLPQWRADFAAIGGMPGADQRNVPRRFERAVEACRQALDHLRQHEREQSFSHLLDAARHINGFAWATLQGVAADERQAARAAGEAFIASIAHWPKGGAQALKDAWQTAAAAAYPDVAANETALRLLCVRGEIAAERATPAEDQGVRRECQVKRLMQRMGNGTEDNAGDLDSLTFDWVRTGPIAPERFESLLRRFMLCRQGTAPMTH